MLPVPETSTGQVTNQAFVKLGANYYHRSGDKTYNPSLYVNYNFLKDRISVDLFMVPIEFFQLSHVRKTERNVYFQHYGKKSAIGDVYINTNIQIEFGADRNCATGRVLCLNPQDMKLPGQDHHIFFCGFWYIDEYRRTSPGWRIAKRVEEKSFIFNAPERGLE